MTVLFRKPGCAGGRIRQRRMTVPSLMTLTAMTAASAAMAQVPPQPAGAETSDPHDIIVTASRTGAQRLQSVPVAITALSADQLEERGLVSLSEYLGRVPSVRFEELQPGFNRITIRGIVATNPDYTIVQDRSLVAVYLDDIPITLNNSNPDLKAVDLERVEVLRGPQGTLYGAGSMAGTVRFITKKPDSTVLSGSAAATAEATQGGDPGFSARASANIPIVNGKAAVRIGAYHSEEGGYIDYLGLNRKNVNSSQTTQARGALRLTPTDNLTIDASAMFLKLDTDGFNRVFPALGDRARSLTPEGFHDNLKVFNITAAYDIGKVQLVSSTSYVDRNYNININREELTNGVLGFYAASPAFVSNTVRNFTQEVRLLYSTDRLHLQIGGFYGHDRRTYEDKSFVPGLDALFGLDSRDFGAKAADQVFYGLIKTLDEQYAVFGEATYSLNEKIDLTAGLRYFNFRGPASYYEGGLAGADASGAPLALSATQRSKGVNPRFVVKYQATPDLMVFAEAARGFRYGGVNYPVPLSFCAGDLAAIGRTSAPFTFGPDHLWSYTIGEKAQFADRRVTVNTSAFLINWRNAQIVNPLACGFPFNENTGSIQSKGVELETVFRIGNHLNLAASLSYTDAAADRDIASISAHDGDNVPYFPKAIVSANADYTIPLGDNAIVLGSDFSHRSGENTRFNTTLVRNRRIPSSDLLNASIMYHFGKWEAGVYGKNLTNDLLINSIGAQAYPTSPGDIVNIGRPRTFGVRVETKF